jgi:RNA polymerase sigma factor (sigma-70 family)
MEDALLFDEFESESLATNTPGRGSNSPIRSVIKDIKKTALLTPNETDALIARVAEGDFVARKQLIEGTLRLTSTVSGRCGRPDFSEHDKMQEGCIALINAVRLFELGRGVRFKTYLIKAIRRRIRKEGAEQVETVHVPLYIYEEHRVMNRVRRKMERDLCRRVTDDELLDVLGESKRNLNCLKAPKMSFVSVDTLSDENDPDSGLEAFITDERSPTEDDIIERVDFDMKMVSLIESLSPMERKVIECRFFMDMTLQETGQQIGRTGARARQIQKLALAKLRKCAKKYISSEKDKRNVAKEAIEEKPIEVAAKKSIIEPAPEPSFSESKRRTLKKLARRKGVIDIVIALSSCSYNRSCGPQNVSSYM